MLNINQTLGRWLPQYPAWSSITIKQLLNMTTPPVNYLGQTAFQKDLAADIHRTFTPAQLVGYAYPYTDTAPWHYSNTNYMLTAMIVAKAPEYPTQMRSTRCFCNLCTWTRPISSPG